MGAEAARRLDPLSAGGGRILLLSHSPRCLPHRSRHRHPGRAFRYAAICSVGSVLGGVLGYGMGLLFMDSVGFGILDWYGLHDKYAVAQQLYRQYDAWAVGAAGFTPIPYKLFTISAGAFKIDFLTFLFASIVSRSARFFLVAWFIRRFGAPVRHFIERYFNLLTILFLVLLVLGYLLVKWAF
ncbi:MAG: VTT domain-containing protein [Desulfobulbaceae bacterium]|nr:VTT domain-containing protein [Desulfobulbaceae bacterium]